MEDRTLTMIELNWVLKCMEDCINNYGYMSVADYNDLLGRNEEATYKESLLRWHMIDMIVIKKVSDGYKLILPEPEEVSVVKRED